MDSLLFIRFKGFDQVQSDIQDIADDMDQIAKTIAETKDFRNVLERLGIILEIQGKLIDKTEGNARTREPQPEKVDREK